MLCCIVPVTFFQVFIVFWHPEICPLLTRVTPPRGYMVFGRIHMLDFGFCRPIYPCTDILFSNPSMNQKFYSNPSSYHFSLNFNRQTRWGITANPRRLGDLQIKFKVDTSTGGFFVEGIFCWPFLTFFAIFGVKIVPITPILACGAF